MTQAQMDAGNPRHHTYIERVQWIKGLAKQVREERKGPYDMEK